MESKGLLCLTLILTVSLVGARKEQSAGKAPTDYYPSKCSEICTKDSFFETELPENPEGNKPYQWAIQLLSQVKANGKEQSPPGVGRALALFSGCVYNAVSAFRSWEPAYIKEIPGENACGRMLVEDVIDGAAFTAISAMFSNRPSFISTASFFQSASSGSSTKGLEFGEAICDAVIEEFKSDGFAPLGAPLSATSLKGFKHAPTNKPQEIPGITQCDTEMTDLGRWQPLCVPTSFLPNKPAETCKVQTFLAPYAGRFTRFAIENPKDFVPKQDPPQQGSEEWTTQAREVLDYSADLTDTTKLVAEYWADGPDSTFPPGHWFRIAAETAKAENMDEWETAKVLLLVGAALNDAGSVCWEAKKHYDSVRPLQMIQCGFAGQKVKAWSGPYKGVGEILADEWQPYQKATFVTPPFAGYVSGHSAFSAAARKVLNLYFGDDNYRAPKCHLVRKGKSQFEGMIEKGEPGYIKGMTDVPNKGPDTKGYVPAKDVVLCWETYLEAAEQAGFSRLHGGIHIIADHTGGARMGENIGLFVYDKALSLWS